MGGLGRGGVGVKKAGGKLGPGEGGRGGEGG